MKLLIGIWLGVLGGCLPVLVGPLPSVPLGLGKVIIGTPSERIEDLDFRDGVGPIWLRLGDSLRLIFIPAGGQEPYNFVLRASGGEMIDENSDGAFSRLYPAESQEWSIEITDALGARVEYPVIIVVTRP